MRPGKYGFTLIELIVVIVIIGVLSSIAAPMMSNIKVRAMCAEAVTAMGAIRTAMRTYYIEHNGYPDVDDYLVHVYGTTEEQHQDFRAKFPGLNSPDDLKGTYFGGMCYHVITPWDTEPYLIRCFPDSTYSDGTANDAPRADETVKMCDQGNGSHLRMGPDGRITQRYISRSGYEFSE